MNIAPSVSETPVTAIETLKQNVGDKAVKATIVTPRTTLTIKIQAVRGWSARMVLHGESFDEAYTHARQLEVEKRTKFVHLYDDPDVIAGQGTIGMEILRQHPDPLGAVFVPIGGGG